MMEQWPTFSLIIPTYNRPQALAACLRAIAGLDYPADRLQVVVVNDGGEPTAVTAVCQPYGVLVAHQANAGPAAARNRGAALATGACLAFIDDDCQPDPGWLRPLATVLQQRPTALVGGHTQNVLPNLYAAASQALIDYLYAYYNQSEGGPRFFTSNNFALTAVAFAELGGFDESFPLAAAEDRAFCFAWRAAGRPLVYVPQAVMYHRHGLTGVGFWRQHVGYGRGAYHFQQWRQGRYGQLLQVEPLSFYGRLVGWPLRGNGYGRGLLLVGLLLLSQVANVWGFFSEARRNRK